ncbi:Outer membrane protein P1 [Brevundimonas sp. NIBR10]|uniref:OmpP1/FadL family transporter n=1 Tax=Brevundimonas sp. NIBR10 TaxID=3015997 RepID=UPI0022F1D99E|nr:outer membrane protein transport protein [Brevundimonas sp. NIBR10]WGM45909.1 Outer membrane protein P1 [Brevundimonas sp. NIBR10]
MKKNTRVRNVLAAGILTATVSTPALAQSFYLQEQSTRGAGRSYSGETADTGVQSLWWNPAAIAGSGREIYLGAHGLLINSTVTDAGSTVTRPVPPAGLTTATGGAARIEDPVENGVLPNFALALPVSDRLAIGVSVAAPYNFTNEYPAGSFTRYDALRSELRTLDAQFTVAMKATDWLDLGVSVSAEYSDAELTTALPNLSPLLPDGASDLTGDGWDYGWAAGLQAHQGPWRFGVSYRSAIEHTLEGNVRITGLLGPLAGANVDGPGQATFSTPWMASASLRYALTPRWTLNAQINRLGWSEFDAIRIAYGSTTDAIVQDYKDITTGAIGVDYAWSPRLTLRAGAAFNPTPTRDGQRSARTPDSDRTRYSVGATYDVTPGFSLDGAVTVVDFAGADIAFDRTLYSGTPVATVSRLRGTAEGEGVGLALGARWSF